MANVANLVVKISADTQKLSTDLKSAENSVENFATKATKNFKLIGLAIGTAAVAGIGLLVKNILDTASALDNLGDSAQAIGLTTKELQRLQFQANLAGSSAEGVRSAFTFMLNAVADASRGSEQQVEAFRKLGLEANALKSLKPEEQFNKIAEAFKNIKNKADQVDISRTIFGRAGVDQINLLNSSLSDSAALFSKLNLGISEGQAENIDKLDKSRKTLDAITSDFGEKLAAGAAPGFDAVIDGINKTIAHFGGLGSVSDIIANVIITGIKGIVEAASFMVSTFKALGVVADGIKVVGATLGVGAAKIISGNYGDIRKDDIAKEVLDPHLKEFADGLNNFSKVDENSKAEVLIDNIKKGLEGSGDAAEKATKKIKDYSNALDNLNGGAAGGKNVLAASLKGSGATFDDDENEFLRKLQAYSKIEKPKSDQQLQDSIISKLSALNTSAGSKSILDIFDSVGARNRESRGEGNRKGGGYGAIWDEKGNFMSVGEPTNVVVTVVLVPDEGRLFNAVVDSQVFKRSVVETSNKNLIDVTRSDRQ